MNNLPETFVTRLKSLLSAEDFSAFLESHKNMRVRGLRVNLLKVIEPTEIPGAFLKTPVPWCKSGFIYDENERPAKSFAYHAGLFYIQEPSAMCPAEVLGVEAGQTVLDICAAPGGKSVQIAGHLGGEGLLVANDASPSRSRALVKNLERAGVTNAIVLAEQPKKLAERFPGFFDRILVDAPCSGEGMFRRDPDAVKAYSANKPEACAAVQREILRHAAIMLRPGGRLVYSTCTFNTVENENVITAFLKNHEEFSLVPVDHDALGVCPGIGLRETARIWPFSAPGEGHFIALLEKCDTARFCNISPREKNFNAARGKNSPENAFAEFCKEFLQCDNLLDWHIITHGSNVYLQKKLQKNLQKIPLELSGLRVVRSGWFLGENAKGRFVPGQALAMGIRKENARFFAELSEEDAGRYLRGESLDYKGKTLDGKPWILICRNGFPLGWARLVQGRLKNNLPVGWAIKNAEQF
ncbi:MAG: RsmB/NOP family class I SAM-dependent RNA methyltransferase [Defluviitaleaceae bacterium]|nr:RsmB/NOP family class I SAM-dependent RNA methyltransferase [Defluviitaleaceae bacterium]